MSDVWGRKWLSGDSKVLQLGQKKLFNGHLSALRPANDMGQDPYRCRQKDSFTFKVLEISKDGRTTASEKTPFDMHLQPRDVSLFTSDPRISKQRATIAPRDGAILFCTETCKAIITSSQATFFPLKHRQDLEPLKRSLLARLGHTSVVPFEFKVLETMLEATTTYFEQRAKLLGSLLDIVIADIDAQVRAGVSISEHERLLPIKRSLTAMLFDVEETRRAIAEIVDNERLLQAVCLTEQDYGGPYLQLSENSGGSWKAVTKDMQQASALLDSYERQVETIEGTLKEMKDNMDDAREEWHMQLDSVRNRFMQINLIISISSLSILLCTIPPAFFGMNLVSGLESEAGVFASVVWYCSVVSLSAFSAFYGYYRYWPTRRYQQKLTDMKALKNILFHRTDELGSVLAALNDKPYTPRSDFVEFVHKSIKGQRLSSAEIDLLYRVFSKEKLS